MSDELNAWRQKTFGKRSLANHRVIAKAAANLKESEIEIKITKKQKIQKSNKILKENSGQSQSYLLANCANR